jgi:hypothetical protein
LPTYYPRPENTNQPKANRTSIQETPMMRSEGLQTPYHPHRLVLLKVNAWVDEGIAPLVEVLNTLNNVETFDSCQGREGVDYGYASVCLNYGDPNKPYDFLEVAGFANNLAALCAKYGDEDGAIGNPTIGSRIDISIQWWGFKPRAFVKLSVHPQDIPEAAKIMASASKGFPDNKPDKQP